MGENTPVHTIKLQWRELRPGLIDLYFAFAFTIFFAIICWNMEAIIAGILVSEFLLSYYRFQEIWETRKHQRFLAKPIMKTKTVSPEQLTNIRLQIYGFITEKTNLNHIDSLTLTDNMMTNMYVEKEPSKFGRWIRNLRWKYLKR
jgi:hypothetical protein